MVMQSHLVMLWWETGLFGNLRIGRRVCFSDAVKSVTYGSSVKMKQAETACFLGVRCLSRFSVNGRRRTARWNAGRRQLPTARPFPGWVVIQRRIKQRLFSFSVRFQNIFTALPVS